MSAGGGVTLGGGCVIPYTQIAVDTWKAKQTARARIFFLSHVEQEKLSGLSSGWTLPIYCSPITKSLLLQRIPINPEYVQALELNVPHSIPLTEDPCGGDQGVSITVTLIDSNYCPGSVMFLFEGYFGRVLYTGDFRVSPSILHSPVFGEFISKPVDSLYLDNTYCSPKCCFPSQAEASQEIVDLIERHPHDKVVLGLRDLGNNDFLIRLTQHFNTPLGVTEERYKAIELLLKSRQLTASASDDQAVGCNGQAVSAAASQAGVDSNAAELMAGGLAESTSRTLPSSDGINLSRRGSGSSSGIDEPSRDCSRNRNEISSGHAVGLSEMKKTPLEASDLFRIIPTGLDRSLDCRIDVIPVVSITRPNLEAWNREHTTLVILATGVFSALGFQPFPKDAYTVELSTHSSYPELLQFVSTVRPKSVVPLARGAGAASVSNSSTSGAEMDPLAEALPDRASIECFQELLDRTPIQNYHIPPAVLELMNQTDTADAGPGSQKKIRRKKAVVQSRVASRRSSGQTSETGSEISTESNSTADSSVSRSRKNSQVRQSVNRLDKNQQVPKSINGLEKNQVNAASESLQTTVGSRSSSRDGTSVLLRISQRTAAAAARQAMLIHQQKQQLLQQSRQLGLLAQQQGFLSQKDRVAAEAALASISASRLGGKKCGPFATNRVTRNMVSPPNGSKIMISRIREGSFPKVVTALGRRGIMSRGRENVTLTVGRQVISGNSKTGDVALNVLNHPSMGPIPVLSIPPVTSLEPCIEPKQEQEEALDLSLSTGAADVSATDPPLAMPNLQVIREISAPCNMEYASQLLSANRGVLLVADTAHPTVFVNPAGLGDLRQRNEILASVATSGGPSVSNIFASGGSSVINILPNDCGEGTSYMGGNDHVIDMHSPTRSSFKQRLDAINNTAREKFSANQCGTIPFDAGQGGRRRSLTWVPVDKALLVTEDKFPSEVMWKQRDSMEWEKLEHDSDQLEVPAKCCKRYAQLDNELNERVDKTSDNIFQVGSEFRNPLTSRRSSFSDNLVLPFVPPLGQASPDALVDCTVKQEIQPEFVQSVNESGDIQSEANYINYRANLLGYQSHFDHRTIADNDSGERLSPKRSLVVPELRLISRKAPSESFIPETEIAILRAQRDELDLQKDVNCQSFSERRSSVGNVPGRCGQLKSWRESLVEEHRLSGMYGLEERAMSFRNFSNSKQALIGKNPENWLNMIEVSGRHTEHVSDIKDEDVLTEVVTQGVRNYITHGVSKGSISSYCADALSSLSGSNWPELSHTERGSAVGWNKLRENGDDQLPAYYRCLAHKATSDQECPSVECVCSGLSAALTNTLQPSAVETVSSVLESGIMKPSYMDPNSLVAISHDSSAYGPTSLSDELAKTLSVAPLDQGLAVLADTAAILSLTAAEAEVDHSLLAIDPMLAGVDSVSAAVGSVPVYESGVQEMAAALGSAPTYESEVTDTSMTLDAEEVNRDTCDGRLPEAGSVDADSARAADAYVVLSADSLRAGNIFADDQLIQQSIQKSTSEPIISTITHYTQPFSQATTAQSHTFRSSSAFSSRNHFSAVDGRAALIRAGHGLSVPGRVSPGLTPSAREMRLPPKKKWRKRYRTSSHQENRLGGVAGTSQSTCANNISQSQVSISDFGRGSPYPSGFIQLSGSALPGMVAPLTPKQAPRNLSHGTSVSVPYNARAALNSNIIDNGYMTRSKTSAALRMSGNRHTIISGNISSNLARKNSSVVALPVGISTITTQTVSIPRGSSQRSFISHGMSRDKISPESTSILGSTASVRAPPLGISRLRRLDLDVGTPRRRNISGGPSVDKAARTAGSLTELPAAAVSSAVVTKEDKISVALPMQLTVENPNSSVDIVNSNFSSQHELTNSDKALYPFLNTKTSDIPIVGQHFDDSYSTCTNTAVKICSIDDSSVTGNNLIVLNCFLTQPSTSIVSHNLVGYAGKSNHLSSDFTSKSRPDIRLQDIGTMSCDDDNNIGEGER